MPREKFVKNFRVRAVDACCAAMSKGTLRPHLVNDILKYDSVDVSSLEPFLESDNDFIRASVVKIIGEKGDRRKLIPLLSQEKEIDVLSLAMQYVAKDKDSVEELLFLLDSTDGRLRSQLITLFRRVGRPDCLFPLVFDSDDALVARIKRIIEGADHGGK